MNKTILVFYVGVGNIPNEEVGHYMERIISQMEGKHEENNILAYYVPVRGADSGRVECVNPVEATPDEYKTVKDVLDKNQRKLMEFIGGVGV